MLSTMSQKSQQTLARIFEKPAPTDLPWEDIEQALRAAGVQVKERPGSRFALVKGHDVMVVRRPHPMPLAVRATVHDIAAFLEAVGATS